MAEIPEGYGLIAGRSRKNAQAALQAADRAGVDPLQVTAVTEGYIVPLEVIDAYQGVDPAPPADAEPTPTEDWKNAEIREWAEAHSVDLGGATTKADMLAAISDAGLE